MTKPPLAERAVAAIARYERAAADLDSIKKGIVAELEKCPITIEAYSDQNTERHFVNKTHADHERLWDGSRVRHHLHQVLQVRGNDGGDYDRDRGLRDDEIRAELEGLGDWFDDQYKCEHCLAAWALIERRKLVRQEFGQAKRLVRALGKLAIQAEPKPPEKPCAARECQLPRVDGTMFCAGHRSVKGRWPQCAITNEQLAHMMQRDGYQQ